jgi:hypothetical protein
MFRPVVLTPSSRRRSGPRVPRWLLLLGTGLIAGAAGLWYVQQHYLPPRLSAADTAHLRAAYANADAERQRLQQSLAETTQALAGTRAERDRLQQAAQQADTTAKQLRDELGALVAALPPDPRGGSVQVRAARLSDAGGQLHYDVMLSRERAASAPMSAVMQLVVAGSSAKRGAANRVALPPQPLTIVAFENLHGALALPAGFDAHEATIEVLDRPGGRRLGMRVMRVE